LYPFILIPVSLSFCALEEAARVSISNSASDVLPQLHQLFPLRWCFSAWAQCWWAKKAEEQIPEWARTANKK